MQKIVAGCGSVLLLLAALSLLSPADARGGHGGGHGGGAHFGGHVGSVHRPSNIRPMDRRVGAVDRNVHRRYVYRNGRWGYWRNGLWIAAPAVAGALYVSSCSYEYNQWRATGAISWRDRYYRCANRY